jgi:hypothetical protein
MDAMDAMEFINNYQSFVDEIESLTKEKFSYVIDKMRKTDPHDLVSPGVYFESRDQAAGFIWRLFKKLM